MNIRLSLGATLLQDCLPFLTLVKGRFRFDELLYEVLSRDILLLKLLRESDALPECALDFGFEQLRQLFALKPIFLF